MRRGRHFDGTQATVPSPSSTPKSRPAAAVPVTRPGQSPSALESLKRRQDPRWLPGKAASRVSGWKGFCPGWSGGGRGREGGRNLPQAGGKLLKFLAGGTTRWQLSCAFNLVNPQPARLPTRTKASLPPKGARPCSVGPPLHLPPLQRGWRGGLQPQALPLQQRGSPPPSTSLCTNSLTHTESDSLHLP